MRKAKHILLREMWKNIPLFLCGVFLVYIAAADDTLFLFIAFDLTNRIIVTAATVMATTIPLFFAVGAIKQSVLIGRETIYYYEKMLENMWFWMVAGLVSISIAVLIFNFSIASLQDIGVAIGCILCGAYLFYYAYGLRKVE